MLGNTIITRYVPLREHDSFRTLGIIPIAAAVLLSVYVVYQRFFSPLAKINGPFLASLSTLWKLHMFRKGDFHETICALHDQYGPIVRIGPSEVILSDKAAIKEIYSTTQGRDYLKVSYRMSPKDPPTY